jgi:hypothetical protein
MDSGMYTKPIVQAHEPDPELYETKEWQIFLSENSNINKLIQNFYQKKLGSGDFGHNIACASHEEIAKEMDKPVHLIRQVLAIWSTNYTSFFKLYGRLFYHFKIKKWCYMDQSHPNRTMWKPY